MLKSVNKLYARRIASLRVNRMAAPPRVEPSDLIGAPKFLIKEVQNIEKRSKLMGREAQKDAFVYWFLKLPAILLAAGAGLSALNVVSVNTGAAFGFLAAVMIGIDGLMPRKRAKLYQIHINAFYDFRIIQNNIRSQWNKESSLISSRSKAIVAQEILRSFSEERERVNKYIRDGESLSVIGSAK